jgi:hypothetical protein
VGSEAIAASLPTWTAFTVTTGVAALLFLQVLHGPSFFAASVTMAWTWLAVPALVLAGYALLYRAARLGERREGPVRSRPERAGVWGALSAPQYDRLLAALCFTAVSFIQSTQMTFMLHPELHHALQTQDPRGLVLPLGLPALFPRWLHMVAGALGTSSLWPMWLAARAARRGEPGAREALAFAAKGFSAATGVAMVLGLGFLASLPARALAEFRGGSAFAQAALVASLGLAVGVRRAMLGPALDPAAAAAAPQWGAIALFAVLLAAGAATIAWMVRAVTSSPPAPRRSGPPR